MTVTIKARSAQGRLLLKKFLHHPKLQKGPLAWGIILLSVCLFFLPFNLPDQTGESLGGYTALSLLPIALAVLLRARRGALIVFLLIAGGTGFYNVLDYGILWPLGVFPAWLIGNVSLLAIGLIAGQIRAMSEKLALTHQQLAVAHEALQKQALTDPLTGLLIPTCNLRCLSEMGKIGHRMQELRVVFKLS